jgi:2-(1,2-epoxy-1,2-dihydrophenyl)acetyl-CoA isomerase
MADPTRDVDTDPVLVEQRGAVAFVILNRPAVLNALNPAMAMALRDAMYRIEADKSVRCVVVKGAGRGFMAGGDVAGFHENLDHLPSHVGAMLDDYHCALRAMVRMEKPVLGALHGPVAGAGMSLALSLDLAIAADNLMMTLAYAKLGTSPDGGSTYFLPRIVGRRKALEIALLSDRYGAADAEKMGLVNKVVPADTLDKEAMNWAEKLSAGPAFAFGWTKKLMDQSFNTDFDRQLEAERDGIVACAGTPDMREGIRAFVQKRAPEFKGE